jgi:hypothetical protein
MVGWYFHHLGEKAMSTVWRFLVKFASLIVSPLHCFDRVILKGHLALASERELEFFVDCILKIRRADFLVCSGEYQKHYFYPFMELAGFDLRRDLSPDNHPTAPTKAPGCMAR